MQAEYEGKIQVVFKHMPLAMHSKAPAAHAAAEAAFLQGKFWEMHDKIFTAQREMSAEKYMQYAQEIGLDVDRFTKDLASAKVKKRIDSDNAEAVKLGVTGTPAFFINGRFLSGAQPLSNFKKIIDEELELAK